MADREQRLRHIQTLDPGTDFAEIYRQMVQLEFPDELSVAFYLAFVRPYALPAVSRVTAHTGEITKRTRKRTADTMILLYTLYEHGFEHPLGREMIRRLNQIHRHWREHSTNDAFVYVLATLVVPPLRYLDRYGWRKPCCHEQTATYLFYRELASHMAVSHFPESYDALVAWFDGYEARHLAYDPANAALMVATHAALSERLPRPLRWPISRGLDSLLDEPVQRAIGIARPPAPVRAVTHRLLRAIAWRRRRSPARVKPAFVLGEPLPYYPDGYTLDEIGPPDQRGLAEQFKHPGT